MAEIGSFRTGIGGFNKADVLNYIDELNARHGEEVEEARRELEEARTQLSAEQQKLEESDRALKQNAEQLSEALQTCKQQEERLAETEQLRQAAAAGDALRRENQELRDQLGGMRLLVDSAAEVQGRADEARIALEKERAERAAESDAFQEKLRELEARLETEKELRVGGDEKSDSLRAENERLREALTAQKNEMAEKEAEIERLLAANRSYEGLMGDLGAFLVEIRSMGQRYLESTYARAGGCLDTIEDTLEGIDRQLAASREEIGKARQELEEKSAASELRLEEWARHLERSAAAVTECAEISEDNPVDEGPGDSAPLTEPAFFR